MKIMKVLRFIKVHPVVLGTYSDGIPQFFNNNDFLDALLYR